jgi:hypothetical protein
MLLAVEEGLHILAIQAEGHIPILASMVRQVVALEEGSLEAVSLVV